MEKTWRWFGPHDGITLGMLRQIGVEGIVTALHHIPNGQVWQEREILERKNIIEAAGMKWSVVESLPVSESIKYGGIERDILIENYIASLENLGKAGIRTVCYNFMPVIDWIRTDLDYRLPDGTSTLYFDYAVFAYFDCRILKRDGAEKDYDPETIRQVMELDKVMGKEDNDRLIDTIIVRTQGFVNGNISDKDNNPVALFRRLLGFYDGMDKNLLRKNLLYFLDAVMPVCDRYGIDMCIHPDDPPYQVLGLPRIVTGEEDIEWILTRQANPHNSLTFCAGSLSSSLDNDVVALAEKFASRTKFVHLRSTEVLDNRNFVEASHLGGRGRLIELIRIFERQNPFLPMRVDHGRLMLGDEGRGYNPGYSFYGRMLALGQVEGMMAVVRNEITHNI